MIRVEEWRLRMEENAQAVLERLRGAADRLSRSCSEAQNRLRGGTDRIRDGARNAGHWMDKLRDRITHAARDWKGLFNGDALKKMGDGLRDDLADSVMDGLGKGAARGGPLLGGISGAAVASALAGLAGAAILVGGVSKSLHAAEAYKPKARDLALANMDLSPAEQQSQRDRVVNLAGVHGLDLAKTTDAYIATQRASHRKGPVVDDFVSGSALMARNLGMEQVPFAKDSAETLKAFNLPLEQSDRLWKSNLNTMALAGSSYADLMQAQQRYALSANQSNQTLETANGLYSALVRNGTDSAKAGSLVASTMEGIAKPKTTKGLEGIGVRVFDAKGQMRQMTDVARDLVPALARMNDQQFSNLRNGIGGNTGVLELLDQARTSGNALIDSLNKIGTMDVANSEQWKQYNAQMEEAANGTSAKMTAAWTLIGNAIKPVLDSIIKPFKEAWVWVRDALVNDFLRFAQVAGTSVAKFKAFINPTAGNMANVFTEAQTAQTNMSARQAELARTGTQEERAKALNELLAERRRLTKERDALLTTPAGKMQYQGAISAINKIITGAVDAWKEKAKGPAKTNPNPNADSTPDTIKQGATAIVGGGKQVRNVNVTIQKLVEKLEVRTAGTVREGISNVRQQVEQALVDIVRGGEAALANG